MSDPRSNPMVAIPPPPPAEPGSVPELGRSPVPWIVGGVVALVALIVTVVLLTRENAPARSQESINYSFDHPAGWQRFSGLESTASAGQPPVTTEIVGIDESNLVVIETFRLFVTVDQSNIDQALRELEGIVHELVQESGGELLSGPISVTMGGFPGYRYQITAHDLQGQLVTSRLIYVFGGAVEYSLNCQHTPEHAAEIEAGCDQIMASFEITGT